MGLDAQLTRRSTTDRYSQTPRYAGAGDKTLAIDISAYERGYRAHYSVSLWLTRPSYSQRGSW
jgi:hypothetical protein